MTMLTVGMMQEWGIPLDAKLQLDTILGQAALDLVAAINDADTHTEREYWADGIDLLDRIMDRLHDAGLAS